MSLKFDKDVPLPPPRYPQDGMTAAIREGMQVGDSFLTGKKPTQMATLLKRLAPMKFTMRRAPEGGYRVWRTE